MNSENLSFALEELDLLMAKVARVHGDSHPELKEINAIYPELKAALQAGDYGTAGAKLKKAAELSGDFTLPADACQAYTRLYKAFGIIEKELGK